jgi:signal transduction histidine kinase
MKIEEAVGRPSVRFMLIGAVWTLFGLLFACQLYFYSLLAPGPRDTFATYLAWQLTAACIFWLVTPLVLWLAERFPIERHNWPRRLLLHLLFSILFAVFVGSLHIANDLWYVWDTIRGGGASGRFWRGLIMLLDREMFVYWATVFIAHAFNYYYRFRKGELKASQLEVQLVRAQLQALKAQLHPHFLFNTLNTISCIMHEDVETADRMVVYLGDFLRTTLTDVGGQEVSLKRELEMLSNYLQIERVRFQNRLQVHMDIEPEALDACVPNLILQPLVENAIKHGIAPFSLDGRIDIRAQRENGMLRIQVCDDGPGISAGPGISEGVGLANTRARLQHLYGAAHRLELKNISGAGFVVDLKLPFREFHVQ